MYRQMLNALDVHPALESDLRHRQVRGCGPIGVATATQTHQHAAPGAQ